jgi:hypothetical protein
MAKQSKSGELPLRAGDRQIRVAIEDKDLRAEISHLLGLRMAIDLLATSKIGAELAGMKLAQLILERKAANLQINVLIGLQPILVRAGVDLNTWQSRAFDGTEAVICTPLPDELTDTISPPPGAREE